MADRGKGRSRSEEGKEGKDSLHHGCIILSLFAWNVCALLYKQLSTFFYKQPTALGTHKTRNSTNVRRGFCVGRKPSRSSSSRREFSLSKKEPDGELSASLDLYWFCVEQKCKEGKRCCHSKFLFLFQQAKLFLPAVRTGLLRKCARAGGSFFFLQDRFSLYWKTRM